MNRIGCAAFLLVAVLAVSNGFSQTGAQQTRARNHDPADEITVKGTVEDITYSAGRGGRMGIHLTLKSGSGVFQVHVGPSSYVSLQGFTFAKGDMIEVIGWEAKTGNENEILARQITKDGKVLTLRDPQGSALWAQQSGLR